MIKKFNFLHEMMEYMAKKNEEIIYGLGWGETIILSRDGQRDYILEWRSAEESDLGENSE